jgi:hypothetical protein
VRPAGPKAGRAQQEIDYGRRGTAGYVFGALQPATGAAFTLTFARRTTVNWVDFLSAVEAWVDPAVARVYAVLDNLNIHSAPDVLLFGLLHPRWEFVFQPTYAAYLNLIEPWWKVLRSLALKGRRFAAWAEIGRGGQAGDRLLERSPASVCLGTTAPPSTTPPPRDRHRPKSYTDLADEPLSVNLSPSYVATPGRRDTSDRPPALLLQDVAARRVHDRWMGLAADAGRLDLGT